MWQRKLRLSKVFCGTFDGSTCLFDLTWHIQTCQLTLTVRWVRILVALISHVSWHNFGHNLDIESTSLIYNIKWQAPPFAVSVLPLILKLEAYKLEICFLIWKLVIYLCDLCKNHRLCCAFLSSCRLLGALPLKTWKKTKKQNLVLQTETCLFIIFFS